MMKVPCIFRVAFLQMHLKIWSVQYLTYLTDNSIDNYTHNVDLPVVFQPPEYTIHTKIIAFQFEDQLVIFYGDLKLFSIVSACMERKEMSWWGGWVFVLF